MSNKKKGEPPFRFMGKPATVVIEVDMDRGRVLRVPVGDLASYIPDEPHRAGGELRILVRDPFYHRVRTAIDTVRELAP